MKYEINMKYIYFENKIVKCNIFLLRFGVCFYRCPKHGLCVTVCMFLITHRRTCTTSIRLKNRVIFINNVVIVPLIKGIYVLLMACHVTYVNV